MEEEIIDRIIKREVAEYERNRAKLFLEAAIGALLRAYSVADVTKILRDQADHLDEFG